MRLSQATPAQYLVSQRSLSSSSILCYTGIGGVEQRIIYVPKQTPFTQIHTNTHIHTDTRNATENKPRKATTKKTETNKTEEKTMMEKGWSERKNWLSRPSMHSIMRNYHKNKEACNSRPSKVSSSLAIVLNKWLSRRYKYGVKNNGLVIGLQVHFDVSSSGVCRCCFRCDATAQSIDGLARRRMRSVEI